MPYDPRIEANPDHGWSLLEAALEDGRLSAADFMTVVRLAVEMYGPPRDPSRVSADQKFLDMIVRTRSKRAGSGDERPTRTATADQIVRNHRIASGEVVPLPDDPMARRILVADARRRGERGDGD